MRTKLPALLDRTFSARKCLTLFMKSTQEITQQVQEMGQWIPPLREQIGRVVIGQKYLVDRIVTGVAANGHILLEGVPGPGQDAHGENAGGLHPNRVPASAVHARSAARGHHRHADLQSALRRVHDKLGPIFANLILADEINRAPAKVQSALLEAMQERQVTIGETTYPLSDPFLVLATQNPLEQEGPTRCRRRSSIASC